MEPYLEHLNITSTDVDQTIVFLQTAMPEFSIRSQGTGEICKRWVHIGTNTSYISVEDRGARKKGPHQPYIHPGLNHFGFVIQDSAALLARMQKAGFREGKHVLDHPARLRYYFFDHDDNEYEFVEYTSDVIAERNAL